MDQLSSETEPLTFFCACVEGRWGYLNSLGSVSDLIL